MATYTYDAEFTWKMKAEKHGMIRRGDEHKGEPPVVEQVPFPVQTEIEAELFPKLEQATLEKFSQEFIVQNRWFRVDSITPQLTKFETEYSVRHLEGLSTTQWTRCYKFYYIEGKIIIVVETDIAPDETHSITAVIVSILSAIATAMAAHTFITMVVVAVSIWTILAIVYKLTGTSVWTPITPPGLGGGGEWIIAIVVLALIGVFLFSGMGKR